MLIINILVLQTSFVIMCFNKGGAKTPGSEAKLKLAKVRLDVRGIKEKDRDGHAREED